MGWELKNIKAPNSVTNTYLEDLSVQVCYSIFAIDKVGVLDRVFTIEELQTECSMPSYIDYNGQVIYIPWHSDETLVQRVFEVIDAETHERLDFTVVPIGYDDDIGMLAIYVKSNIQDASPCVVNISVYDEPVL